jgi:glycosyl transferase, family 25
MRPDDPTAAPRTIKSDLRVYLINLDRATDRRAYMDGQLRALGIDYERVAAVDGKALGEDVADFDPAGYRRLHGRRRHPGEIGCYMSHLDCLRRFLDTDAEFALILEDDGRISDDLPSVLDAAIENAGDWDILRLSTVSSGKLLPFRHLTGGYRLAIALTRQKGSAAYLVNRQCAKCFLDHLVPMRLAWDIAYDLEYLWGQRAAFVSPVPVDQNTGLATQIQSDTRAAKLPASRYLTVFPFRAYVETRRFIARSARIIALKIRAVLAPER